MTKKKKKDILHKDRWEIIQIASNRTAPWCDDGCEVARTIFIVTFHFSESKESNCSSHINQDVAPHSRSFFSDIYFRRLGGVKGQRLKLTSQGQVSGVNPTVHIAGSASNVRPASAHASRTRDSAHA